MELESGIEYLAKRYPELDEALIRDAVCKQLEAGSSVEDGILFVQMACSIATHRREMFDLNEAAAVLGLSVGEAADALSKRGLQCAIISPAPGFEGLFGG